MTLTWLLYPEEKCLKLVYVLLFSSTSYSSSLTVIYNHSALLCQPIILHTLHLFPFALSPASFWPIPNLTCHPLLAPVHISPQYPSAPCLSYLHLSLHILTLQTIQIHFIGSSQCLPLSIITILSLILWKYTSKMDRRSITAIQRFPGLHKCHFKDYSNSLQPIIKISFMSWLMLHN